MKEKLTIRNAGWCPELSPMTASEAWIRQLIRVGPIRIGSIALEELMRLHWLYPSAHQRHFLHSDLPEGRCPITPLSKWSRTR